MIWASLFNEFYFEFHIMIFLLYEFGVLDLQGLWQNHMRYFFLLSLNIVLGPDKKSYDGK